MGRAELNVATPADRLRLMLVTDGSGDADRIAGLCAAAVAGGVTAVQLREPALSAAQLFALCERLQPLRERALLLVNDRVDVAAAARCDGAHLGHRSLPPGAARAVLGRRVMGCAVHTAADLDRAAASGCDYAVLAPVLPTTSKPGAAGLGFATAAQWTATASLPVLWLGGIDESTAAQIGALSHGRPAGIAVRSAICSAADPERAARALRAAVHFWAQ